MDCMVYYDAQRVEVIVRTDGLLTKTKLPKKDIIVKEVTIPTGKYLNY
jgi:hypothetical protein